MAGYKRSQEAKQRLEAMVRTTDGFEISETDLQIRGAGDFFGTRQSGLPDLKIADLVQDVALISEAREAAGALLRADPRLEKPEHQILKQYFERYFVKRRTGYARIG